MTHLLPDLKNVLFPLSFIVEIVYAFLSSTFPATCLALTNFLDLITRIMLGRNKNQEVPHCAVF
jgi:hypothetical protein